MTADRNSHAVRLQLITVAWMLVELGVSAYSAFTAHSAAMLAFGSDSMVETLSAAAVLSQWLPGINLSERRAARISGVLFVPRGTRQDLDRYRHHCRRTARDAGPRPHEAS